MYYYRIKELCITLVNETRLYYDAWSEKNQIVKGFKQWVGTDDGMLWNGSEENGNVRSECEEDEGTDCESGDSDTD
jgi:hypothetical protein